MAIGWIAAFKALPWTEILAAAPVIVQGAGKLWKSVRRKPADAAPGAVVPDSREAQLHALEARVAELEKEALAGSELVRELASQNARLVEAVEILRVRTRILAWAGGVALVAVAALAAWIALR